MTRQEILVELNEVIYWLATSRVSFCKEKLEKIQEALESEYDSDLSQRVSNTIF